ncbi:MAG: HAMP domain-containing protein [Lentisphaeria bacterium]|nr:HAMP domain-containing protein [Lentisphaeria bacterium]
MSRSASARPRRRYSLSVRLLAAYGLVVVCSVGLVALPVHVRLRRDYVTRATQAFGNALFLRIDELRAAAEAEDRTALDLACDRLNAGFQGRVSVLARDGAILGDSMSALCLDRALPECLPAIRAERDAALRHYQPLDDTVSIRLPLVLGSAGPVTVRLALPIQPVRDQMSHMNRMLAVSGAGGLLAAAALALWLARRIARPVEEMTRAAERIAAGAFDAELPAAGGDEIGRLAGAFGTMQACLRQTLDELRAERNQAHAVVNSMSDGVVALSSDGVVLYANAAAAELLDSDPPRPGERLPGPAALLDVVAAALRTGGPLRLEMGDVRQGERVVRAVITPLAEAGQAGRGVVLVLADITEARRAESLGRELVANASHELRTPLAIVGSTADTLLAVAEQIPAPIREFLHIIERQAERMRRLVDETLQLSVLESGMPGEPLETLDVRGVVRQALDALGAAAAAKGIEVRFEEPVAGVCIPAFEAQLTGAVRNLLDNAIRYTPPGGKVTVSINADAEWVCIEVADTGPGIAPLEQRRIFERFVRGRAAGATQAEGSGLGLAIVRRVAEIHRGTVDVSSRPGEGSTFRLRLPRSPQAPLRDGSAAATTV